MTSNEITVEVVFQYSNCRRKNIKRAKASLKPIRSLIFRRKKYAAPGLCQVDGGPEYRDGYCRQHHYLSTLLKKWVDEYP